MISNNAEIVQKSFTEQAKRFESKTMSFTKQEYLEHTVSCIEPKNGLCAGSCGGNLCLRARSCPVCPNCALPRYDGRNVAGWKGCGREAGAA